MVFITVIASFDIRACSQVCHVLVIFGAFSANLFRSGGLFSMAIFTAFQACSERNLVDLNFSLIWTNNDRVWCDGVISESCQLVISGELHEIL